MKVSDKYYDEIFDFRTMGCPSKCGLKIITHKTKVVIVAELYQDNPGTSITYNDLFSNANLQS